MQSRIMCTCLIHEEIDLFLVDCKIYTKKWQNSRKSLGIALLSESFTVLFCDKNEFHFLIYTDNISDKNRYSRNLHWQNKTLNAFAAF